MSQLVALNAPPEGLFWSEPLERGSDFTAEDPLALDALGRRMGRELFGGFTTRTDRAQYYVVVLYGLDLVDRAIHRYEYPGDDETRSRLFERWERFWALASLESTGGDLRKQNDTMRGVRGATRAWNQASWDEPLPLDFPFISRQSEMGALGAYLSSLRAYGLVGPGSLRVTPAAKEIIDALWGESDPRDRYHARYDEYALTALDFGSESIPRKWRKSTLNTVGVWARLSCLEGRPEQQERLWNALFVGARDGSTLPLAEGMILAYREKDHDTESFLEGLLEERWLKLDADNRDKAGAALAIGRVVRTLLERFNRAYQCVVEHGWVADFDQVAAVAFPDSKAREMQDVCRAVLNAPKARQLLEAEHITLFTHLGSSGPRDSLEHLLRFHGAVQHSRRRGGPWIREAQGKLMLQFTGYDGYHHKAGFPHMKFYTVRKLLADLGRIKL